MWDVLPAGVRWAETDPGRDPGALLPDEERALGRVCAGRRSDFAAARSCARRVFSSFGLPPLPVLPDADGAPQWPAGLVGSVTHCVGYAAAAVARSQEFLSVGIDAEPVRALPEGVLAKISDAAERAALARLRGRGKSAARPESAQWECVLFSAKESVYKAWFPLTRAWLGFHDAHVSIDPAAAEFVATLQPGAPPSTGGAPRCFTGRFAVREGIVRTAVAVSRR